MSIIDEACQKWNIQRTELTRVDLLDIKNECYARIRNLKFRYSEYPWSSTQERITQREAELKEINTLLEEEFK